MERAYILVFRKWKQTWHTSSDRSPMRQKWRKNIKFLTVRLVKGPRFDSAFSWKIAEICALVWNNARIEVNIQLQIRNPAHHHRVPTPPPTPRHVATAGKYHLNEEITPIIPTGIGERYCQTISNLGHAPMWTPPINKSAELTSGGPLVNSLLWAHNKE